MKQTVIRALLGAIAFAGCCTASALADPSGLFIVPTTDTQSPATARLGVGPSYSRWTQFDGSARVGLGHAVEAGYDSIGPYNTVNVLNAKLRLHDEGTATPSLAVGIRDAGRETAIAPAPNMLYAVAGKHIGPVRLTAGAYRFSNSFANYSASAQQTGLMVALDTHLGPFHPSIEHVAGHNPYGMTAVGVGYNVGRNVTVTPTYVVFNDRQYGSDGLRLQINAGIGK